MFLQRTELLIGSDNIEKLKNSNVIVFGLGGVGGATVEALVRAGIGNLSIVDFDTVDKTNLNRQIITTQSVVGKPKVEVAKDRVLSINPDINLTIYNEKFLKENIDLFFKDKKYDYIVDAIDLVTSKLDLIEFATNSKIPIISCMGTGNKVNPTQFKVTDINKTSVCPLAKIIRKELKKRKINKLKVVYSDETPRKPFNLDGGREKAKNVGSISFVPPVAGTKTTVGIVDEIEFFLKKDDFKTFNVKNGVKEIENFENLILVTPTYQVGEAHAAWMNNLKKLEEIDFTGKVVGLVGLGNQFAFGESFCGGIRYLYDVVVKKGGKVVGFTSTDGYHYEETSIIEDGKFIGLALDEENQPNLTPKRIGDWITEIKKEFK